MQLIKSMKLALVKETTAAAKQCSKAPGGGGAHAAASRAPGPPSAAGEWCAAAAAANDVCIVEGQVVPMATTTACAGRVCTYISPSPAGAVVQVALKLWTVTQTCQRLLTTPQLRLRQVQGQQPMQLAWQKALAKRTRAQRRRRRLCQGLWTMDR